MQTPPPPTTHQPPLSRPHIPIDHLLQQGCDCYYSCCKDKVKLGAYGLDWEMVEMLPELVDKCAKAQAQWVVHDQDRILITGELRDCVRDGIALRSALARNVRNNLHLVKSDISVRCSSRNRSVTAVIEDLYSLVRSAAKLLERCPDALIDKNLVAEALTMHEKLRKKYTSRMCYDDSKDILIDTRNALVVQIHESIATINRIGQELFNGTERVKAYRISYYRTQNEQRGQGVGIKGEEE